MQLRRVVIAAIVPTLVGLVTLTPAASGTPTVQNPASAQRWNGPGAVTRLGSRISSVARAHGMGDAQLRTELLRDRTLYVDGTDELFYVEPLAAGAALAATASAAVFDPAIPAADAFLLHSKPGAARVIYLDFDGHLLTGTAWNASTGGDCVTDAYDSDGVPATFSDAERAQVISTWKRVAEDYAAFDVDVTTQDPLYAAINRASSTDTQFGTRLIVTKSGTLCPNGKTLYTSVCSGGCGGIAYVGVYDNTGTNHDYYQPAIVFQNGVGSGAKNIAEAAAHEVGHNIGLSHDGTATTGYYSGQGSWAPIMGVGYYKAISQWSKGEYAGANQLQDDFVVATQNGLPLRTDDHGNTTAAATGLSGSSVSIDGVISTRTDVDVFSVTAGAGPATFTASPAPISPDLDIRLELRDATGTVLAASDPASGSTSGDAATGMNASITITLTGGTYTLVVDGVGSGDPATTGYSDYASVGHYRLTGTVTGLDGLPPTAVATASVTSGVAPLAVTFTGSGSSDPEGGALTFAWAFGDGGTATLADTAHTYSTPGTYTATLTVTDPTGYSSSASVTVTVTAPVRRIDVASLTVSGTRVRRGASAVATVTVRDAAGAAVSGASVRGTWYLGTTVLSTRTATSGATGVATLSTGNVRANVGQVLKFCVTSLSLSGAVWDPTILAPTTTTDCATWTIA